MANTRVLKKLAPEAPGAIKLSRRFGEALVCVRHRMDADGETRITTVELVVERVAVQRRAKRRDEAAAQPDPTVGVRIRWGEMGLRERALNEGARWDPEARVWRMPRSVALALDFEGRIVESG